MGIEVGVDVGGTFTDAAVAAGGEVVRAKAHSTKKDVTGGILDALSRVRQQLELGEDEFFASIEKFVLGNTIVTNVIDERRFPAVGLLTTAGFKDTLRIARSARGPSRDAHRHTAPPELVRRDRILEVTERVDVDGRVLREADRGAVRAAVEQLLESGAEAIAVCFLWSFKNPVNEQAVAEVVRELSPALPITLSSDLAPVYREYERMVTTVLDAACKPVVATDFDELEAALRERGLRGGVKLMQVDGGFVSVTEAANAPIKMFNSGPVGGVDRRARLGRSSALRQRRDRRHGRHELRHGIIAGRRVRIETERASWATSDRRSPGRHHLDRRRRRLDRVGRLERGLPRSARRAQASIPGPACYGRGGDGADRDRCEGGTRA